MEKVATEGRYAVLAKGNWKLNTETASNGKSVTRRDDEAMGTMDIKFIKITGRSIVSIAGITLNLFPCGAHHADFLGAVTGKRFCLVYSPEKHQCMFAVYQIDESNKKASLKNQFVMRVKPSAIMAIQDKVFLGFHGQTGYVDLTQPSLSLKMFHAWEQPDNQGVRIEGKSIDAFAYDSSRPDSELVAIDDFLVPKFGFTYNVSQAEPKNVLKFDLPSGTNEFYKDAVKHGNRLVLTASYHHIRGQGNRIVILDGINPVHTITEHVPHGQHERIELLVGNELTGYSSVGLLNGNVILVSAGKRGVIAIPIDQINKRQNKSQGVLVFPVDPTQIKKNTSTQGIQNEVDVPHGVRRIHVGTSAAEVVTVKDKSVAFILGTTIDTNRSVLSQVRWNEQSKGVEVVHSENVEGVYERLFMEV